MARPKSSKNKKPDYEALTQEEGFHDPLTSEVKVTLKSVGRTYRAEGKTLAEALGKIKISGGARAISVLIVEKGEQKKERIISADFSQKLFSEVGPTMKEMALKKVMELVGL